MPPRITDEIQAKKERIKALWNQGFTATIIGQSEGLTRSAVLGQIHRMGLPKRSTNDTEQQGSANAAKQRSKPKGFSLPPMGSSLSGDKTRSAPAKIEIVEIAEPFRIDGVLVTMETLEPGKMCRWPIGDPLAVGFYFCGIAPKKAKVYCEFHYNISKVPSTPNRRHS